MKFTKEKFMTRRHKAEPKEVEGYTFEAEVNGRMLKFGVNKEKYWSVTDLRTGRSISLAKTDTRKQAVDDFFGKWLKKYEEFETSPKYQRQVDEFLAELGERKAEYIEEKRANERKERKVKAAEVMESMGVRVVNMDELPEPPKAPEPIDWKAKAEQFEQALIKAEKSNAELRAVAESLKVRVNDQKGEIAELRRKTDIEDMEIRDEAQVERIAELEAKLEDLEAALSAAETKEPVAQDDAERTLAKLIAEHSKITVKSKTSCAIWLDGIEQGTPEHEAAKEAGCRFGKSKKHGNRWYIPR